MAGRGATTHDHLTVFGQTLVVALSKTYALRMAAVFMVSLATIWLRTGLMPRPLAYGTYLVALALMAAAEVSMLLVLTFPAWVLVVSALIYCRALTPAPPAAPLPDTA